MIRSYITNAAKWWPTDTTTRMILFSRKVLCFVCMHRWFFKWVFSHNWWERECLCEKETWEVALWIGVGIESTKNFKWIWIGIASKHYCEILSTSSDVIKENDNKFEWRWLYAVRLHSILRIAKSYQPKPYILTDR